MIDGTQSCNLADEPQHLGAKALSLLRTLRRATRKIRPVCLELIEPLLKLSPKAFLHLLLDSLDAERLRHGHDVRLRGLPAALSLGERKSGRGRRVATCGMRTLRLFKHLEGSGRRRVAEHLRALLKEPGGLDKTRLLSGDVASKSRLALCIQTGRLRKLPQLRACQLRLVPHGRKRSRLRLEAHVGSRKFGRESCGSAHGAF